MLLYDFSSQLKTMDPCLVRTQVTLFALGHRGWNAVSCRYAVPQSLRGESQQTQLDDIVRKAIRRCIRMQPALQVSISHTKSGQRAFFRPDSLDFNHHLEWERFTPPDQIDSELHGRIMAALKTVDYGQQIKPGWEVIILQPLGGEYLEILFAWNHPGCDSMSGKIFHQGLLQSLNVVEPTPSGETENAEVDDIVKLRYEFQFPPPIEKLIDLSPSIARRVLDKWLKLRERTLRDISLAHWAPIFPILIKTQYKAFRVDDWGMSVVLTACSNHWTTVTGLLHSLILFSLASHTSEEETLTFQAATAIDLRPFVPDWPVNYEFVDAPQTMGNFSSEIHHAFEPEDVAEYRSRANTSRGEGYQHDSEPLCWATAETVSRHTKAKMDQWAKNDFVGISMPTDDGISELDKAVHKARQLSWAVTDLGAIGPSALSRENIPRAKSVPTTLRGAFFAPSLDRRIREAEIQERLEKGEWKIERAQSALSAQVTGAALMFSLVRVPGRGRDAGKGLCVGCSWQEGAVKEALARVVMNDLERWFGNLVASKDDRLFGKN
ncbi:hypothetical protein F4808DRAFT_437784 [Astrocystis sublimbata]|nr:hypothetical protein F4808DRAFT_437784 [Astrocystis sublimbata]